jgi:acetylornithine deacetylase/succinyl-diaminopimelate desuccinylase-like protein
LGTPPLPGARLEVAELAIDRPPVESDEASPLVQALEATYREVTGGALGRTGRVAYTDAAIIQARRRDRHAVVFGPGSFDQAHALDEWAPVEEIVTCAEVLTRTAERLLG